MAFKQGLTFFHKRSGDRITPQLFSIAHTIRVIGQYHADVAPDEIEEMKRITRRLLADRRPGLTDRNHRKLAQFDAPRIRDGIILLPQKLRAAAVSARESGHFSKRRAASVMLTAVAIELLLFCPMRISNLASLDLKRHVRRSQQGGVLSVHLYVPAHETKNQAEIHCELPAPAAKMLEEYIEKFRPDLPAPPSTLLFPGANGGPRSHKVFWKQIVTAGRRYLGIEINPHLFRHLAAKLYLDQYPGGYEVVRRTFGHKSMDTTVMFYAGQETGRSLRHFDKTILKLRDEASAKPGRGVAGSSKK